MGIAVGYEVGGEIEDVCFVRVLSFRVDLRREREEEGFGA